MARSERPMRVLFVGGPGRSGTSFVADRLTTHPQIAGFKDIELKIFCEKNGLLDLFHALVQTYSPNRAVVALDQFRRMTQALVEGRYGQPALSSVAKASMWNACFETFTTALSKGGHPAAQSSEMFFGATRALLCEIAGLAASSRDLAHCQKIEINEPLLFLEKTPHNLLAIEFLTQLAPGAAYLHVMRDPRSIAWSLLSMRWGPNDLVTAVRWVDSYCRAWCKAEAYAAQLSLPLTRLHIEDVAADPSFSSCRLTQWLGITAGETMFAGADLNLLNRWTASVTEHDHAVLDSELRGWTTHFGYDLEHIGRRRISSIT